MYRPISAAELEVVRAALAAGRPGIVDDDVVARLPELFVRGGCECGCASVDFTQRAPGGGSQPLVSGHGVAPGGQQVGWILWGWRGAITGLEVYGLGDDPGRLPAPGSMVRDAE
jgi:hypothetical protein